MNIETYREYCISKKGATEGFPFPSLPDVLVFKVAGKMFSATNIAAFSSISIKCDPESVDEMRANYPAVMKPVYFSERHWSSVLMDHSISDKLIFEWLDTSYDLTVAKLTKKIRAELGL